MLLLSQTAPNYIGYHKVSAASLFVLKRMAAHIFSNQYGMTQIRAQIIPVAFTDACTKLEIRVLKATSGR